MTLLQLIVTSTATVEGISILSPVAFSILILTGDGSPARQVVFSAVSVSLRFGASAYSRSCAAATPTSAANAAKAVISLSVLRGNCSIFPSRARTTSGRGRRESAVERVDEFVDGLVRRVEHE